MHAVFTQDPAVVKYEPVVSPQYVLQPHVPALYPTRVQAPQEMLGEATSFPEQSRVDRGDVEMLHWGPTLQAPGHEEQTYWGLAVDAQKVPKVASVKPPDESHCQFSVLKYW